VAVYSLLIKPSAAKELDAIGTKGDRQRVVARIQALAADPRPAGCEKLVASANLYRVRQGQYRVIFTVDDVGHTVEVIKVGHRREVYRRDV
jgi:mRNA interferase RelE/StbE